MLILVIAQEDLRPVQTIMVAISYSQQPNTQPEASLHLPAEKAQGRVRETLLKRSPAVFRKPRAVKLRLCSRFIYNQLTSQAEGLQ